MAVFVLIAWLVQAAAGVVLLARWLRHGRQGGRTVVSHVAFALVSLGLWIVFVVSGSLLAAWLALGVVTVGNAIGDRMLIGRSRRLHAVATPAGRDYGTAIADTFRGRMPRTVTFHALFAGVVYFSCLGVCIGATIAG